MAIVEDLFIYPFKSARGIRRSSVRIIPTGFEWDRHWMAVDQNNRFISQRTHPRLAQIVPELASEHLFLTAPGMQPLDLPLSAQGGPVSVRVWDDVCSGLDQGDEAAGWLSQCLAAEVRVVRVLAAPDRHANPKWAGSDAHPMTFADGYPILVCNRASLEDLNTRMPEAIPMERFRPNIVLGGLPAFAEDRIDSLRLGDIELRLVKPCTRCIITSTDQVTGDRTTNPLPVLRTFRFDRNLHGVAFGENAVVAAGVGAQIERGGQGVVKFDN
jgi:uncharacterized protein YcbX